MMSYQLERAFGRVLNLDYAQVNPGALTERRSRRHAGLAGHAACSGVCGPGGGVCIPNPAVLRYDDIAALNRIYPITAANLASFPGKKLTAANTVSIQGSISFRPAWACRASTSSPARLTPTATRSTSTPSPSFPARYFNGNHGNPVTGWDDANGNLLTNWGSNNPALQGFFDLSDMPLPPGVTTATYLVTFEAVNPLYIQTDSVGPYLDGKPTPSGTLPPISLPAWPRACTRTLTVNAADSAAGGYQDAIGTEASPRMMPGQRHVGRPSQPGRPDRLVRLPVRGNRTFTVVTQALDETGAPTEVQSHARDRRVGCFRPGRLGRRRRGARPQRPRHRRKLAAVAASATTWSASALPISAATAAPTTPTTAGCSTPTPSSRSACPLPAAPS